MGVKNFFKVFPCCTVKKQKQLSNMSLGIDVSYDIYRASLGMKSINGLTDKNGNPTVLINVLLCNLSKYKQLNVNGIIYIFDHPDPNPLKLTENKKRTKTKGRANEILKEEKDEARANQIEKRTFSINKGMIADIKKVLNYLNIAWVVAPKNYEAEHLGAELMKQKIIDTLITTDSDTLMFGGHSIMRKVKIGSQQMFEEYKLQNILSEYKLEYTHMVKAGVILGTDFCEKTPRVGVKTVLKKLDDIELTEEQIMAYNYFTSECPFEEKNIYKSKERDIEGLVQWLVDEKNFNETRVRTILNVFNTK